MLGKRRNSSRRKAFLEAFSTGGEGELID